MLLTLSATSVTPMRMEMIKNNRVTTSWSPVSNEPTRPVTPSMIITTPIMNQYFLYQAAHFAMLGPIHGPARVLIRALAITGAGNGEGHECKPKEVCNIGSINTPRGVVIHGC